MSLESLISELEKKIGKSKEEILKLIKQKQAELSNLISEEGAAYLVARDFGIKLLDRVERKLKIKNIVSGMRRVDVYGRIFKISKVVEFEKNGNKGKVVNLWIGDDTGYVRIPLWNDQAKIVEEGMVKEGDVIKVSNAYTRENIFGDVELSLGRYGGITLVEDSGFPSVDELVNKFLLVEPKRTSIEKISLGLQEIRAFLVHVFKGKFFFDVCPICGATLSNEECEIHGKVEKNKELVISCIADDGTGSLRVVFFRDNAEKALGVEKEEIIELEEEERYEFIKEKLLGREFILRGRVKRNKTFNRIEMIVNDLKPINILDESKKLMERLGYE